MMRAGQCGQALAEGLVAMLALIVMAGAVAWLYRWQDIALQATHASRALAFEHVRNPQASQMSEAAERVFHGGQHWNDRRGKALLPRGSVRWGISVDDSMAGAKIRSSGLPPLADSAWRELGFEEDVIATASIVVVEDGDVMRMAEVSLQKKAPGAGGSVHLQGMRLARQTSILSGAAGHAESHGQAQQRIAGSLVLWRSEADASMALGRRTETLMRPVDAPWKRPLPDFDWLSPWAGRLPAYIQKPYGNLP
ncbi:hypothetical protein [Paracandidimonas soli]|uniref:hypothetical protein n=1 Tax=Paracandidimonas soli TaxID=1917182 RepID=UPI0033421C23